MPVTRVAIVVDSAASLPADMRGRSQLHIVPMRLTFGDRTYLDGLDLSTSDFYQMLRESRDIPSTSAPSPSSFLEAFRQAAKEAEAALCLTVSSRFSACFNSAMTAVEEAHDALPGFEVSVLDTETAAGGEGLVAVEAWRTAARGGGLAEAVATARSVIPRVKLLAMVDTLDYLRKSGRVPAIAQVGATLLRIKPIFELVQGDVHTVARPRTRGRAVRRLVELMRERAEPGRVHATVMHADAADAAEELKRQVEAELTCEELYISEFTPVMGAHIGPRLLGVAFRSD